MYVSIFQKTKVRLYSIGYQNFLFLRYSRHFPKCKLENPLVRKIISEVFSIDERILFLGQIYLLMLILMCGLFKLPEKL